MTDLQVMKDAIAANLGALLHGSDDESSQAVGRMTALIDDDPSFGAFCGMLAEIAADALKEQRASFPAGPARSAMFAMQLPKDMSLPERMAAQLITASANDDHETTLSLLVSALSWQHPDPMSKLVAALAVHARVLHLSVCSDPASDVEEAQS